MPDRLSVHGPLLVNTLGHCAGSVVFGMLVYLFWLDWRRSHEPRSRLSAFAALLALLWNVGSLVALGSTGKSTALTEIIVALSFSVLSLLPAVLLQISLEGNHAPVWMSGYGISAISIALHLADMFTAAASLHYAALLLITFGFSGLTVLSILLESRSKKRRGVGSRLGGAMCLFLLAISFVHLGAGYGQQAWSGEIALHHAGLPLALFVLLHDFRFLLLDAFLRFLVNAVLAAGALYTAVAWEDSFHPFTQGKANDFRTGISFALGCILLALFAYVRSSMQRLLTRVVFLRSDVAVAMIDLHELGLRQNSEDAYLPLAGQLIANFMWAEKYDIQPQPPPGFVEVLRTRSILERRRRQGGTSWAQAVVTLRFSRGDSQYLLLGTRLGGRPFLSEDFEVLSQLSAAIVEQVERLRNNELQTLAVEAEFRALQAQINPHFLFNAFNTLYGTISRENSEARRLVLNLSDVFRYCLRPDTAFVRMEEELKIVRAYLEIEQLRLGSKLSTKIEVDRTALDYEIPVLLIQPLVENAVKHGVAARPEGGSIQVRVKSTADGIGIEVSNSGDLSDAAERYHGAGVGLANVRRRLTLCYGSEANLDLFSEGGKTIVSVCLPQRRLVLTAR